MSQNIPSKNISEIVAQVREPVYVVLNKQTQRYEPVLAKDNVGALHSEGLIASLPPLYPEWLGNADFLATHQLRFPYAVGEMANGIASAECVIAAVKSGFMGSFGAAGLMPDVVEKNLQKIYEQLQSFEGWGANLIFNPNEPALEEATVNLFLRFGVQRVSASAYMSLSPFIVHYAFSGLHTDQQGKICRKNHVLAKISRVEVARLFMTPVPSELLAQLVSQGKLTPQEADLAKNLPVAEDITAEADSGGHTDNRPLGALFPVIQHLAAQMTEKYGYVQPLRVGAAGGLGTPTAVAAAFAMGAAYVLTGSVNQSAVEAGICPKAKAMLAQADMTDVEMAPAADMFELGVKLQVLKRGTLFSRRALKFYELYAKYPTLEAIPAEEKENLEQKCFHATLEEVWKNTKAFFAMRDPRQVALAEQNPKHRMALVFRSYLGLSSRWAISGDESRVLDYQLWCGPAMGAFNDWVKGSFLETLSNRTVQQIGYNLLEGAAVITRAAQLRSYGVAVPLNAFEFIPRPLS